MGELAEMMFMVKAASRGFGVCKPYGDSERYDFVLDAGERFVRVQVKSSSAKQYGAYLVNIQRHANGWAIPYTRSEIDFVVAWVLPEDAWFVIPVKALKGRKSMRVCLRGNPRHGEFGKYFGAWGLMCGESRGFNHRGHWGSQRTGGGVILGA
jgi:hypothetical protein